MKRTLVAAAFAMLTLPALAAPQGDWPCVQRKVPEITPAAIGATPEQVDTSAAWRDDEKIKALVEELAARRLPIEEATQKIAAHATEIGGEKAKLAQLFGGLIDRLNAERSEIIAGIERYGHKQKELAELLRQEMRAFDDLRADKNADPVKVSETNDKLIWDTRIFDERQKSLSYVCEVPVLIEQRLFALGRAIIQAMK